LGKILIEKKFFPQNIEIKLNFSDKKFNKQKYKNKVIVVNLEDLNLVKKVLSNENN